MPYDTFKCRSDNTFSEKHAYDLTVNAKLRVCYRRMYMSLCFPCVLRLRGLSCKKIMHLKRRWFNDCNVRLV